MPDEFFKEPEEKTEEAPIEKIKVGEKEYTQDELQDLVGMGEKTREIESSMNTKIDRVYPEYTKATQRNKEYEEKIKEYEAKSASPQLDEESIRQAKDAARKIGLVTKDDFAQYMQEHFRPMYNQEQQAKELLNDCKALEKEMDGTNGQPKFKTEEVLQWMADNGGRSPRQAYKMIYEKQIDEWKQAKLGEAKRPGMMTETGGNAGGKEPARVPVTRDNIEQLMKEALGQGEE